MRRALGKFLPTMARTETANAMSVAVAIAQPWENSGCDSMKIE